jgi:CRISPR-associated protein Cas6
MTAYEFSVKGGMLPQNHGYEVLSALSKVAPFVHGRSDVQIAPIGGRRLPENPNLIELTENSFLHIRGLSAEEAMSLTCKTVWINGFSLELGGVRPRVLTASPRLSSRLVVFEDAPDKGTFRTRLVMALKKVTGELCDNILIGRCRAIKIQGIHLLGYSVDLRNLSDEASLKIQQKGIGSKTSMGCGVFRAYSSG